MELHGHAHAAVLSAPMDHYDSFELVIVPGYEHDLVELELSYDDLADAWFEQPDNVIASIEGVDPVEQRWFGFVIAISCVLLAAAWIGATSI